MSLISITLFFLEAKSTFVLPAKVWRALHKLDLLVKEPTSSCEQHCMSILCICNECIHCVYMYVCMCMCMYVYIYIYIYIYVLCIVRPSMFVHIRGTPAWRCPSNACCVHATCAHAVATVCN